MFKINKFQYINMRKNAYVSINNGTITHDKRVHHALRKYVAIGRRFVEAEVGFLVPLALI